MFHPLPVDSNVSFRGRLKCDKKLNSNIIHLGGILPEKVVQKFFVLCLLT